MRDKAKIAKASEANDDVFKKRRVRAVLSVIVFSAIGSLIAGIILLPLNCSQEVEKKTTVIREKVVEHIKDVEPKLDIAWEEGATFPTPRVNVQSVICTTEDGNKFIYWAGGRTGKDKYTDEVWFASLNEENGAIENMNQTTPLPSGRELLALQFHGSYIYAFGARGNGNNPVEILCAERHSDGTLGNWSVVSVVLPDRSTAKFAKVNGSILMAFGQNEHVAGYKGYNTKIRRSTFLQPHGLSEWSNAGDIWIDAGGGFYAGRSGHSIIPYNEKFLYVFGGQVHEQLARDGTINCDMVLRIEIKTDSSLGTPRELSKKMQTGGIRHHGGAKCADYLIAIGGVAGGGSRRVKEIQYTRILPNRETCEWNKTDTDFREEISGICPTVDEDNMRIYVAGGEGDKELHRKIYIGKIKVTEPK
ncbi:MAG: hypothetical protein E3J72_14325 [Planctomycetota bacterium]|nr:MAG: hypothetical protein E3J72_14325 [Planctomycetota bacterium]